MRCFVDGRESPLSARRERPASLRFSVVAVVNEEGMGRLAREDVHAVLSRFGIAEASRAIPADPTEEAIFVSKQDFESVDVRELTLALMDVLPHTKVWVFEEDLSWSTEPI
jgi:hypothetical protein